MIITMCFTFCQSPNPFTSNIQSVSSVALILKCDTTAASVNENPLYTQYTSKASIKYAVNTGKKYPPQTRNRIIFQLTNPGIISSRRLVLLFISIFSGIIFEYLKW